MALRLQATATSAAAAPAAAAAIAAAQVAAAVPQASGMCSMLHDTVGIMAVVVVVVLVGNYC